MPSNPPAKSLVKRDRVRSVPLVRHGATDDPFEAALPRQIVQTARSDAKARDEPIDLAFFDAMADATKTMTVEPDKSPESIAAQVVKFRLFLLLLIRELPPDLRPSNRDMVLQIARSAADDLNKILEEIEAGGMPEPLGGRFNTVMTTTLSRLKELRDASAQHSREKR
jgi:hypothetical protein